MILSVISPLLTSNDETESLSSKNNPMFSNPITDIGFEWSLIDNTSGPVDTVVDDNDNTHVVYNLNQNEIKYATDSSGTWVNQTIASASIIGRTVSFGQPVSIAIDSSGFVHISVHEQDIIDRLIYITNKNGTWDWTELSCECGGYSSIAIDSNDEIHISHVAMSLDIVKYSHFDGNTWSTYTISSNGNGQTSIAVDQNGDFHITYHDQLSSSPNIRYVVGSIVGSMVSADYFPIGNGNYDHPYLSLNNTGKPQIVAVSISSNDLELFSYNTSTSVSGNINFDRTILDTNLVNTYAQHQHQIMNIDSNDDISVLYYNNNGIDLAYQENGIWQSPINLNLPTNGDIGRWISADLDSDDKLRISYMGNYPGNSASAIHHVRLLPDIYFNSITPNNAELGDTVPVTITGDGFDMLPKYTKEIDITNDFDFLVQDYSIFVENPTYDETDLVASYHFEDDDLVGVKDTSGNELDGTINGNPTHDEGVNGGNSLDLDGANDIVQIPDDDLLDLGGEDFTVMLWARRDGANSNPSGNEGLLTKNDVGNYNGYSLVIPVVGGGTSVTYSCLCGGQYIQTSLGKDVGIWHHIGMTYDHSTSTVQMYADGVADGSGTVTITDNDIPLILGSFYNGVPNTRWNGAIDDVKIYSRALSPGEIGDYYYHDYRADYGDVRFWDSDGNSLDYEMLSDGNFMVNIPSMTALETRTISMTYGALGLESESQPLDDWLAINSPAPVTPVIDYFDEETFYDDAIAHWKFDDKPSGYSLSLTNSLSATQNSYSSLVVDSIGNLHMAYNSNNDLVYSTNSGGGWVEQIVDSSTGADAHYVSIAVDSNDDPHISHCDVTSHEVMYAYAVSGSWSTDIAKTNTNCKDTAIALDSNDIAHISYTYVDSYGFGFLGYAKFVNGWATQTLANLSSMTYGVDIAVDSNDFVHIVSGNNSFTNGIVYFNNTANNGNTWSELDLDSTTRVANEISLEIDSADNLHISYRDVNNNALRYATNSTGVWEYDIVDNRQLYSIGVSNDIEVFNNDVYVSYRITDNYLNHKMGYAVLKEGNWNLKIINTSVVQQGADIEISPLGEIYMSYYHQLAPAQHRVFQYFSEGHANSIEDSSNNSYHVESNGGPLSYYDSKFNSGIYFDGVDDYLTNETLTSSDFDIGTGEFTLSTWFNPDSLQSTQNQGHILFQKGGLELFVSSDKWAATLDSGAIDLTDYGPEEGKWVLATLVRETSPAKILFYVNGEEVFATTYNAGGDLSNNFELMIGAERCVLPSISSCTYPRYIHGTLDDIFVLDTALNSSEISDYYQATVGPRIHFTMDEDSGKLIDISGNEVNANPYGCPTYNEEGLLDDSIRFHDQWPSCGSRFEVPQLSYARPSPDFSNRGESFTLSAWVKLNSDTGNDQWIISQQNSSGLANEAFQLKWTRTTQNMGYWECNVNTHVSGFLSAQSTETSLSTDWNMLMCRFANDGLGVDLLINGEIDGYAVPGWMSWMQNPNQQMKNYDAIISIGEDNYGGHAFDGWIDEVRFYDYLMDIDDAISLYYDSFKPTIFYDFEEAYAITQSASTCFNLANDSSGYQNHGMIFGTEPQCGETGFYGDGIKFQEASNDYVQIDSGDWQNSSVATVGYDVNLSYYPQIGEVVGFSSDEFYNNGIRAGISLGITSNGNVECQVGDSVSNTAPSIVTTNLSLTTGVWYHLLCSWDDDTLKLYIDGVLSHTHTPAPGSFNGMSWGPGFSGPGPALLGKYSTHFSIMY